MRNTTEFGVAGTFDERSCILLGPSMMDMVLNGPKLQYLFNRNILILY